MIKVGLTGNIGSGKSTVSRIFETLGIPVFRADDHAKEFLKDENILIAIKRTFGDTVFTDNQLDRKKLATFVFKQEDALAFLNSLIHPKVRQKLMVWFENQKQNPYVIQEAAILFESGFYKEFDKIIMVTAPTDLCIRRVMQRDGAAREEVEKRLSKQWQQEKKIDLSHFIIYNDENNLLIPQVLEIHHKLSE